VNLRSEVEAHVANMFDLVLENPPRPRTLRSSSLPYCPVLDVVIPRETEEWNMKAQLYTSMGTVAHTVLQAFASLGKPGKRVFGCWECPRCKHKWTEPEFRPDSCPNKCNDAPAYVELTLKYGALSGHCDMVIRYGKDGDYKWVVWDFKTCGGDPGAPKKQHLLQARTYCGMIRRQYRVPIHAYCIVYIGRDKLDRWVYGPYNYQTSAQQTLDWINRSNAGFKAATVARKLPNKENLLEVARCRPCTDNESHDEYMARRYEFRNQRCSMLGNCKKSDLHVAKIMKQILET
jgi:hypothetical protein